MNLFKFFHKTKDLEKDIKREKECIARIKTAVSQRSGVEKFIEYDDFTVAFAGTSDNMELMLEITTVKCEGKKYLYASVDDEVSWQEWDFDNTAEFEKNIIEYISNRINRTIKEVIEVNNKNFSEKAYYLSENGEWVCFEEHNSDSKWFCFIMNKLTESSERIKNYKLKI